MQDEEDLVYSTGVAYFLWLISGFGALGFHRFYLGKFGTGLLYMFTGGLMGIGSIYDLLTLPFQVHEANLRNGYRQAIWGSGGFNRFSNDSRYERTAAKKETIERVILKVAKKNNGIVTPSEVALEGGFDLDETKKALEKLVSTGFAEIRVKKTGTYVYFFSEFSKGIHPDLEDF